jgi:aryl-phospho-beta-D-glucosidase BglC (GH1 family)
MNLYFRKVVRLLCFYAALVIGSPAWAVDLHPEMYLHTVGRALCNSKNSCIQLHGVNLGGWLVTEGWMNGQTDSGDRWALEQLEARFGTFAAAQLMSLWQSSWITSADIDLLHNKGYNLLRVPFSWRNLQDPSGQWIRDKNGNIDFTRFDWIVDQAAQRGMYVMFDLHIWQGQRQDYSQISRLDAGGDAARKQAAAIWSELAKHFVGVGTIAAFDLINEPTGSPADVLQTALYNAVRAQDPARIVIVESVAYSGLPNRPWTNFIWSAHYPTSSSTIVVETQLGAFDKNSGISLYPNIKVPIYIGEMKAPQDSLTSAAELVKALNKRSYSWSVWTYKGVSIGGWAGFNYYSSLRYNLTTDSYDSISGKWSALTAWQDPTKPISSYLNTWWFQGFH